MNLIVILPLFYFISAHPVELPPKLSAHRLQMMEQEILNHLSELALALKPNDIPEHVGKLSLPQLSGCITPLQRGLIKTCISRSHCISKSDVSSTANEIAILYQDCSKMEIQASEEHEDVSPDVIHDMAHSILPTVMECVVGTLSPPDMVGFTNVTYVKKGIIDTTSLSEAQRTSALPVLESCLSSTFSLPEVNGTEQLAMMADQGNNAAIATKAMICAAKAILLNGCPTTVQTKMAEQQMQVASNVAAANDSNSAQSSKSSPMACTGTHPTETPVESSD